MIKQSNGVLACIAEDEDRFTLGEAKDEMLKTWVERSENGVL